MNRVKEYRKKAGITQEAAAKRLGISITYLSIIENGKANLTENKMRTIAEFFGATVAEVFFSDGGSQNCHNVAD